MGYTTRFSGELKFTQPLTKDQEEQLRSYFGEDFRDHPEWQEFLPRHSHLSYIDLTFAQDMSGLKHDGSEKTYYFEEIINSVLKMMRKKWPEFGLTGALLATGEEAGDIWKLVIGDDGIARRAKIDASV